MALSKKEEGIVKAQVALTLAQTKLHTQNVLVNEELKTAHKPINDAILATHKVVSEGLSKDVADARTALKVELNK